MVSQRVKKESFHYKWSKNHKPVLYIKPGDEVIFEVNEVTSNQINPKTKAEDLKSLDPSKFYPLSGPVYIEGAKPGDALIVKIKEIQIAEWGWSAIIPGFGLLEEFNEPYIWHWDLKRKLYTRFVKEIRIPLKPFCGVMGNAPAEEGEFDVMPPSKHGGNMDVKYLSIGSKLFLPVFVEGALFSLGDLHAAQGDGEVCVTAIETFGEVRVEFDLLKDANITMPYFEHRTIGYAREYIVCTGIDPDLMNATKIAVRNMISFLMKNYGLSKEEAYILCSVIGDLRIHEVVDRPNWVVGIAIPKNIFPKSVL